MGVSWSVCPGPCVEGRVLLVVSVLLHWFCGSVCDGRCVVGLVSRVRFPFCRFVSVCPWRCCAVGAPGVRQRDWFPGPRRSRWESRVDQQSYG
uniref:Putative secreted protein n=1 Tax=Anopheles marajoara TaxID=58244 RepID=A0A2M4C9W3_9DIPT